MLPRRTPRERPDRPFTGYKLAHAVIAADGRQAGFAGLSIGAHLVYGVVADAACGWRRQHAPPRRRCGCGFYCFHALAEARALACATANQPAVLLEVTAAGRYLRYERGLCYSRQRVRAVRVGRCACGRPAAVLADAGRGMTGWRFLHPACAACAAYRPSITPGDFARLLGGQVPVLPDTEAAGWPGEIPGGPAAPAGTAAADAAAITALGAEIALVHARLDHLQAQVSRLQGGPGQAGGLP